MCYCFIWILATYAEQNRQESAFTTLRSPYTILFSPHLLSDQTQRRDNKKVQTRARK